MRGEINRHSVVFDGRDIADDPFGTGIGGLLEAALGAGSRSWSSPAAARTRGT